MRIKSITDSSDKSCANGHNVCNCKRDVTKTELSDVEEFLACNGSTNSDRIIELLLKIKQIIPKHIESQIASQVASQLNLGRDLYNGRDRFETLRIRAQILYVLASSFVPKEAKIYIDDLLRNSQDPTSRAVAALAAGNLGIEGKEFVPSLIQLLSGNQYASPVVLDLKSFSELPDDTVWTTDRLEAIRALGCIGDPSDETIAQLNALTNISNTETGSRIKERIAAQETLSQLLSNNNSVQSARLQSSDNVLSEERPKILHSTHMFNDQDGRNISGSDLLGVPNLVAFFYTSCRNPARCSTTTSQVVHLRHYLDELQISASVNLSLITLEPEVDNPERLKAYADLRGIICDSRFRFLKPDSQTLSEMSSSVDLSVSRCCNTITNHEATLFLLDGYGRLVNRYSVGSSTLSLQSVAEELRKIGQEKLKKE
ncbi:SCO family protein [Mangrovimonas sp. TPBH4]|uniref:SCO family protein n=1 Tax=Mangrovimonas sp. TPBH4 TaxID=1645914 RepID=UPI0006B5F6A2|nr:SCO family protein [Mangrovimonas sp. TPBH4]